MTHRCHCVHHEHWRYPRKPLWILYGIFGCLSAQFGNCNHTLLLWNSYLRFPSFALFFYASICLHVIVPQKSWSVCCLENLSDSQVTCLFFCGVFSDPSFPIVSVASCPFVLLICISLFYFLGFLDSLLTTLWVLWGQSPVLICLSSLRSWQSTLYQQVAGKTILHLPF